MEKAVSPKKWESFVTAVPFRPSFVASVFRSDGRGRAHVMIYGTNTACTLHCKEERNGCGEVGRIWFESCAATSVVFWHYSGLDSDFISGLTHQPLCV